MQYIKLLFLTIFFVSADTSFCKQRLITNNTDSSLAIKINYIGTSMFTPCSSNTYTVAPGKEISVTHSLQDCELFSIEVSAQSGSLDNQNITVPLKDIADKESVKLSIITVSNNMTVHIST